jgi:MFS family permease
MSGPKRAEFARGWTVILAAAVGVGLGTTGLPIYTTGQFIGPLQDAFGWTRAAAAGGLTVLTIVGVLTAPVIGALVERLGVRPVALTALVGLALGYAGLTLNGGSLGAYYLGWAVLAVLGAGTCPIVWTRAVASWFVASRGLALGVTLCGTGVVAMIGPGVVGGIIAAHGWKAGFYALAAAQLVIALPLVFLLFRSRDTATPDDAETAADGAGRTGGATLRQAAASGQFWRLLAAFFLIAVVVGGLVVNLPPMLVDRGIALARAARALGLLGVSILVGRLTIGLLVDRLPARLVAPVYVLLPALSCLLLARGRVPVIAILMMGLSAGAEVDLLAYLASLYFGVRHYARIYAWNLSVFGIGVGIGPVLGAWVHDRTGHYLLALYAFAAMAAAAAALIASLGRPVAWPVSRPARRQ